MNKWIEWQLMDSICRSGARLLRAAVMLLVLFLLWPVKFSVAEEKSLPLTAAYVFYFTKFVAWPEDAPAKLICVASDNLELKAEFEKIVVKSNGAIALAFIADSNVTKFEQQEQKLCHLIYLTADLAVKDDNLPARMGVLFVVDEPLVFPGAVMRLVLDHNKLGFIINRRNAKKQGLDISAKLLSLAKDVED